MANKKNPIRSDVFSLDLFYSQCHWQWLIAVATLWLIPLLQYAQLSIKPHSYEIHHSNAKHPLFPSLT